MQVTENEADHLLPPGQQDIRKMHNTVHGGFYKKSSPSRNNNYDQHTTAQSHSMAKSRLKSKTRRTKSTKKRGPNQHLFNNTFYQDISPHV